MPVKAGIGIAVGDNGAIVTNRNLIEGFDDFRVSNGLTRVVANISSSADLAVLVENKYSRKGLPVRDHKSLKEGEKLYSLSWQQRDYYIADPGEFAGIRKNGAADYICMKGAGHYGSTGAVLVDKDGKVLGISADIEDEGLSWFVPISSNESLTNNNYVRFLSELGVQIEDVFDYMELKFEGSSVYDGNTCKVVYNVVTNIKNYEDYKVRIEDEAFRNKIITYFESLVKSKADLYGIKDYSFNLNLKHYVLSYEIKNGVSAPKQLTKQSRAVSYLPNNTKAVQKQVGDEKAIIVDKAGVLSTEKTIAGAISKAVPGTRIIVQPGIYNESILVNKDNIEISGADGAVVEIENNNALIIEAENVRINGIQFVNKGSSNPDAVLIKKGQPVISGCIIQISDGTAVKAIAGSFPRLLDNPVKNNRIFMNGNGVELYEGSKAHVLNNIVESNQTNGIHADQESTPIMKGNYVSANKMSGIYLTNRTKGLIEKNRVSKNGYQGILVESNSIADIIGNDIAQNTMGAGIAFDPSTAGRIELNTVYGNRPKEINVENGSKATKKDNKVLYEQ